MASLAVMGEKREEVELASAALMTVEADDAAAAAASAWAEFTADHSSSAGGGTGTAVESTTPDAERTLCASGEMSSASWLMRCTTGAGEGTTMTEGSKGTRPPSATATCGTVSDSTSSAFSLSCAELSCAVSCQTSSNSSADSSRGEGHIAAAAAQRTAGKRDGGTRTTQAEAGGQGQQQHRSGEVWAVW